LNALSSTDGNNADSSSPVADYNSRSDIIPLWDANPAYTWICYFAKFVEEKKINAAATKPIALRKARAIGT